MLPNETPLHRSATTCVSYLRRRADEGAASDLERQRRAVEAWLDAHGSRTIAEIVEDETHNGRPKLEEAIDICRGRGAKLLVARLGALSRSPTFISRLRDASIEVAACDFPAFDRPALEALATLANAIARHIGVQTKFHLAAARERGVALGGFRGKGSSLENLAKGRSSRLQERASSLIAILAEIDPDGRASLRSIARELNRRKIPTLRGVGAWTPTAVTRLRARLKQLAAVCEAQSSRSYDERDGHTG